jgi:carbon-monoxide dehydrogenase medium subunit
VKPAPFAYHAPRTIDAAVGLLAELVPEEGRVLAGGQSLVPAMALRLARPGHLIDINGIADLDRLVVEDGALSIGACVRHAAVGAGAAPGPLGRLLGRVQRYIAHPPIRARGTFCGSLAHADAASEWCMLAVTLDARITVRSTRGVRTIAAVDFFQGYMATTLEPDEMIVSAAVPLLHAGTRCGFYELARRAGDFAQVMALATFEVRDGTIHGSRIGLGGLESRPRRITGSEAALDGRPPSDETFQAAARVAAATLGVTEDPDYARALAEVAVLRALADAA